MSEKICQNKEEHTDINITYRNPRGKFFVSATATSAIEGRNMNTTILARFGEDMIRNINLKFKNV